MAKKAVSYLKCFENLFLAFRIFDMLIFRVPVLPDHGTAIAVTGNSLTVMAIHLRWWQSMTLSKALDPAINLNGCPLMGRRTTLSGWPPRQRHRNYMKI